MKYNQYTQLRFALRFDEIKKMVFTKICNLFHYKNQTHEN